MKMSKTCKILQKISRYLYVFWVADYESAISFSKLKSLINYDTKNTFREKNLYIL